MYLSNQLTVAVFVYKDVADCGCSIKQKGGNAIQQNRFFKNNIIYGLLKGSIRSAMFIKFPSPLLLAEFLQGNEDIVRGGCTYYFLNRFMRRPQSFVGLLACKVICSYN